MNLFDDASPVTLIIYLLLLAAAAIQDVARLTISNLTIAAIALLAIVAAVIAGPEVALWQNLAWCIGLLVVGTLLFATGKFGGGDVKLLAANGLWFDLLTGAKFLAAVFIAGGILALVMILARIASPARVRERRSLLKKGASLPYGVAIAAGAVIILVMGRS